MVVFELTMPNRGSWNNRWSQESFKHYIIKRNDQVPKELVGRDYIFNWDDGWTALVSAKSVDCRMASRMKKESHGFCGYDWMVESIIRNGEILKQKDWPK